MIDNLFSGFTIGILLFFLVLSLLVLIAIILTLIHQAKRGRWIWFVLTLLLTLLFGMGLLMTLIYWAIWVIVPEFRRKK